jgi:hypothetical protein
MRLRARGGPPAGCVLLDLAQLGATAARVGLRTRAVTDSGRCPIQCAGGIRQHRPGPSQQADHAIQGQEGQCATQAGRPAMGRSLRFSKGLIHGTSLAPSGKKTDRTRPAKIAITRVLGPKRGGTGRHSRVGADRTPFRNEPSRSRGPDTLAASSNIRYEYTYAGGSTSRHLACPVH